MSDSVLISELSCVCESVCVYINLYKYKVWLIMLLDNCLHVHQSRSDSAHVKDQTMGNPLDER